MALGAMEAVRVAGRRVPQDVSVVGFDDIPQASRTNPPLTTVRQPLEEMGRRAVRLLLAYIADPNSPPSRIELPTELIIRGSCRPLRSSSES
jgi:LacI family transcriptional regulator